MTQCERCEKTFRDNCDLNRHMSRIIPCKATAATRARENSAKIGTQQEENVRKLAPVEKIGTLPADKSMCRWCWEQKTIRYIQTHETICKMNKCPVRILELELYGNTLPIPCVPLECRFCNKNFSRTSNLRKHECQEYNEYHAKLLAKQTRSVQKESKKNPERVQRGPAPGNLDTSGNIIINVNGNVNNNNNYWGDITDPTTTTDIIELIRRAYGSNNKNTDTVQRMATDMFFEYHDRLQELPENRTLTIRSPRSQFGTIATAMGNKLIAVNESLDTLFKLNSARLFAKRPEIELANPRLFKQPTNRMAFTELERFGDEGFGAYQSRQTATETRNKLLLRLLNG